MEKNSPNSNAFDTTAEQTLVIADYSSGADCNEDALAALPVKPQDRYKFIRSIGFGGMKGVLLVHDQDTERDVAMAIMPDFRDRPRRDLNRFVREAHITAKLEHPNIVPVHDIGIDGSGSPFFTMKYLHGQTLAMILRQKHSLPNCGNSAKLQLSSSEKKVHGRIAAMELYSFPPTKSMP